ncbi:MAG: hypothetical protein IPJ74_08660 [Saprospiraceae bacterium]|nr:hypothetical protein [Saprospiraceae bacterium]
MKAALRYYGILVNASNKEFDRRLNKIETELKQKNLDEKAISALIAQKEELS